MKKLKLVATISTLCLALMVICFGVYSATNVTYTIGGSISYEVNDVFATVETDVYTSSFNDSTKLKTEAEKFLTNDAVENAIQTEYKYDFTTTGAESESYSNTTKMDGNTEGGIKIAYNTTSQRTYFVVISITNNGDNIISASVTGTLGENANTTFVSTDPIISISKSNKQKIVLAFMLDDITLGVSNVDFDYTAKIGVGKYEPQAATFRVETVDEALVISTTDFYGSSHTFNVTADFENPKIVWGCTTWLYNIFLTDVDLDNYNALLITVKTDQVVFGIGVIDQKLGKDDSPLAIATGISANTDVFISSINITKIEQDLCFGIATENVTGVHATVTLKFINQIIDETNKLKYTPINNDTELSVAALSDKISGDVVIPSTYNGLPVTEIESGTASDLSKRHVDGFALCENITSIFIPSSIKRIGSDSFSATTNIQKVIIEDLNAWVNIDFGLYQSNPMEDSKSAILYLGSNPVGGEIVLSNINKIGKYTFARTNITKITIPNGVKSIEEYAFQRCTKLNSVVIPNGVEIIDQCAFQGCEQLMNIELLDGLKHIGGSAFANCVNLSRLTIPSSVTKIEYGIIGSCKNLKTINYTGSQEQWNAIDKDENWDYNCQTDLVINYNYDG